MTKRDMDDEHRERLHELIAAYGAEVGRWPTEARALLGGDALEDAVDPASVADAQRLDALLRWAQPPAPDVAATARLTAAVVGAPCEPVAPRRRPSLMASLLPAGAVALAVMLGVIVGQALPQALTSPGTGHGYDGALVSYYMGPVRR